MISDDQIREIFIRNGFVIPYGRQDLKPYVYAAALELIAPLVEKIAQLERGEFICKRCGLRRDGEHSGGGF